jgi:translocation and assembly module TamB
VLPGGEDESSALPDVELSGRFAGAAVDVILRSVGPLYAIEGAARLAPLAADGQLSGEVAFAADDLDWVRTLDQRITDLGGALAGRAALGGTAVQPVIEGTVELRDGRLALEDPDVRLERIGVTARFDRTGAFDLDGRAVQPHKGKEQGFVELAGSGTGLFGGELALEASLRGERMRATHPQWEVEVAPELEFTYVDGRPRLTGLVALPRADVRFNTLPTSVPRPSPDVIVVGRESAPSAADRANRLRMNVRVRLGRDVKLRALGMEAGLRGELNVRRDARGQASVRGTLDVTGGLISAQGQVLAIESGTVVYNGPIANPYVDIRAVREIKDQTPPVKVGLRIRGDVHRLTSTVFSEPPMAENRALAFLVLGRDIDQESTDDNNQLLTAAINLGLRQSKSLTGQLQRMTGLDELSAVAEAEDSFAIAAGKRIGESIFLRYTYNTLTAAGAILVSFDLSDRWRLEALSGESASMDILYRIER